MELFTRRCLILYNLFKEIKPKYLKLSNFSGPNNYEKCLSRIQFNESKEVGIVHLISLPQTKKYWEGCFEDGVPKCDFHDSKIIPFFDIFHTNGLN